MTAGVANADSLHIRGEGMSIVLRGRSEHAIGVRPQGHNWQLELSGGKDSQLELFDVTRGARNTKWNVSLNQDRAQLDDQQFTPGHAYRVFVRHGMDRVETGVVYLYPPRAKSNRVQFDDDSVTPTASNSDEGINIVSKGSL